MEWSVDRKGLELLYVIIFAGLAVLLVAAVLIRNAGAKASHDSVSRRDAPTAEASRTTHGSGARRERKRRRAQSRTDHRKRP